MRALDDFRISRVLLFYALYSMSLGVVEGQGYPSSDRYSIVSSQIGSGGGASFSGRYSIDTAVGELWSAGVSKGGSVSLRSGFIAQLNSRPQVHPATFDLAANGSLNFTLAAIDAENDPVSYVVVSQPQHGVLTGTPPQLNYQPDSGYVGQDTIEIRASDGEEVSDVSVYTFVVSSEGFPSHALSGKILFHGIANRPVPVTTLDVYVDGSLLKTIVAEGDGSFSLEAADASSVEIRPRRTGFDRASSGVNVLDILALRKDILALERFDSPLKVIAADCNRDGLVSVGDIIAVREVILGRKTSYSSRDGVDENLWRFVPLGQTFADARNPFAELNSGADRVLIPNLSASLGGVNVVGIKLGDVDLDWQSGQGNGSALQQAGLRPVSQEARRSGEIGVQFGEPVTKRGGEILVPVHFDRRIEPVTALQLTLGWDASRVAFVSVESDVLEGFDARAHTLSTSSELRIVWDDASLKGTSILAADSVLYLTFKQLDRALMRGPFWVRPRPGGNLIVADQVYGISKRQPDRMTWQLGGAINGNPNSGFAIRNVDQQLIIRFSTSDGEPYRIQKAAQVRGGEWVDCERGIGDGGIRFLVVDPQQADRAFYRLVRTPAPQLDLIYEYSE